MISVRARKHGSHAELGESVMPSDGDDNAAADDGRVSAVFGRTDAAPAQYPLVSLAPLFFVLLKRGRQGGCLSGACCTRCFVELYCYV